MSANHSILDYHKGEGLHFTAALKNRDGSILSNPQAQTVTLRFSGTGGGDAIAQFDAAPQVTLTSEAAGVWTFQLTPADMVTLPENVRFFYNIWSRAEGETPIVQISGPILLQPSIE